MANDLLKYSAIGVLLFGGYRYWRAYKVGSNLDIEISGVMANAISKNNFSIGVNLDVTNKSTERITLSNSNLKCYINGRYVGVAKVPYTQIINASTTTKVFVVVDVFYKEVFAEWWNMFVQLATTVKLTIAGSLKFNGVYVPIPAIDIKQFKMSELFGNDKASVSGCSGINTTLYSIELYMKENIFFRTIQELMGYISEEPESIWDILQGKEILKIKNEKEISNTGKFVDFTKYYPRGATYSLKYGKSKNDLRELQKNKYRYVNRFDESPYYYSEYEIISLK